MVLTYPDAIPASARFCHMYAHVLQQLAWTSAALFSLTLLTCLIQFYDVKVKISMTLYPFN